MNEQEKAEWRTFTDGIAAHIHKLVANPANMRVFRDRATSFADRWKEYVADSKRFEQKRIEHWKRVKAEPRLQDVTAGPPEKKWRWDTRDYLYGLPPGMGPEHEMPAKYTLRLIKAIQKDIRQRKARTKQERSRDAGQDREIIQHIHDCRRYRAKIRPQYKRLTPEEKGSDTVRILIWLDSTEAPRRAFSPLCWYEYLDIPEDQVFGCWRPPLRTVPENPCKRLVLPTGTDMPSKAADRAEQYERYYLTLAYIHDSRFTDLADSETITKPVWSDDLFHRVQWSFVSLDGLWIGPGQAYIERARDEVTAELQDLAEPEEVSETPPATPAYVFKRAGSTGYTVAFGGCDTKVVPRVAGKLPGLDYIHVLMQHEADHNREPNRFSVEMSSSNVMHKADGIPENENMDRPHPQIDDGTWKQNQDRRTMLTQAIEDERDPAKIAEYQEELDGIDEYLAKSMRPGANGKPQAKAFVDEAARKAAAVRKAIDRAIEAVRSVDGTLADHLKNHIKHSRGSHVYAPDSHVDWVLE